MYKHFFKRLIDFFLSFIGIIILAIPMLIIALAIKCDSKGPVFFKQNRVGKKKKIFKKNNCYKSKYIYNSNFISDSIYCIMGNISKQRND